MNVKSLKETSRRVRSMLGAATLIGAATAAVAIAGPLPAEARCTGAGAPGQITAPSSTGVYTSEVVSNWNTCDGLGDYNGQYTDTLGDGGDAYILIQRNGVWETKCCQPLVNVWKTWPTTFDVDGNAPIRLCDTNSGCHTFNYANNGF